MVPAMAGRSIKTARYDQRFQDRLTHICRVVEPLRHEVPSMRHHLTLSANRFPLFLQYELFKRTISVVDSVIFDQPMT